MKTNVSSKKRREKEKKTKRKIKDKEKEEKLQCFSLKPEHGLRGIWRKPFKPGALSQLVGSQKISARYMGGWVELSKL